MWLAFLVPSIGAFCHLPAWLFSAYMKVTEQPCQGHGQLCSRQYDTVFTKHCLPRRR